MRIFILIFIFASTSWAQSVAPSSAPALPPSTDTVASEDPGKKMILLPLVYYTPETKFAGGALLIKNFWKEKEGHSSHLIGTVSLSMNNQVLASLSPKLYFDKGNWDVNGTVFYSYYPNKFYGRGVNNSVPSPESYVENSFLLSAGAGKNIHSHFFVRGSVSQDQRKIIDYDAVGLVATEIANVAQSLEVQSLTASIEWDQRDYPQAPKQGAWYRIGHTLYAPRDREGSKELSRFRKIDFDFRQYISLSEVWTAAAQLHASEMQGDVIPFQYLSSVGGGNRMRGYYGGQFRDKALGLAQVEVRYAWKPKWIASLFGNIGRMGPQLQNLANADSLYTGGFGMHYILDPENRTKLRLDFGFTGKNTGFYFLIGEAF